MTTISFKSEEETERLAKILSPNVDRLRKLLETLPLKENADGDLIETVLERLCFRIQLAASSEIQRHGWHRGAGTKESLKQLRSVEKLSFKLLEAIAALRREALQLLFAEGTGHNSAEHVLRLRQAALKAIAQLEQAPEIEPERGPNKKKLEAQVSAAVAEAYSDITGERPTRRVKAVPAGAQGDTHKTHGPFPEFLEKVFAELGIDASSDNQSRGKTRRKKK